MAPRRESNDALAGSAIALRAVLVAMSYVLVGAYAAWLQDAAGVGGIYWPAAGVAVGGLLTSPRRTWPAILAAIAVLQATVDLLSGHGLAATGLWIAANVAGHVLVAGIVVRWRADTLSDVRSVIVFVVAAFLGTLPAGLIGAGGLQLLEVDPSFAATVATWTVGDALGILTVAPFVLVLGRRIEWPDVTPVEAAAVVATVAIVAISVFTWDDARYTARLSYIVLVPLVWAAMRLRLAGAAVCLTLTSLVAVTASSLGRGPFSSDTLSELSQSVLLHLLLLGVTVTTLLLASRTVESEAHQEAAVDRERLLAAVSHELRTPLTPIVGFSELLLHREPRLDDGSRDGLRIIHRNGRHLTSLIDDLLLLSRDQRDQLVPEPQQLDLTGLVTRYLHEQQAGDVTVRSDGEVGAWADPEQVERIISNLVTNARRYGAPPIVIEVSGDGDDARLVVSDHGKGVSPSFEPFLFDVFAQETDGDRRPTSGLGLGLPICRTLAHANGGELSYDGDHTGDARFVLHLPGTPTVDDQDGSRLRWLSPWSRS